jgi:DNA polymerase I-like protein with 3'-5' exonuclease and polymerase domains
MANNAQIESVLEEFDSNEDVHKVLNTAVVLRGGEERWQRKLRRAG